MDIRWYTKLHLNCGKCKHQWERLPPKFPYEAFERCPKCGSGRVHIWGEARRHPEAKP